MQDQEEVILTRIFYSLGALGIIDALIQLVSDFRLIHWILGLFFNQPA